MLKGSSVGTINCQTYIDVRSHITVMVLLGTHEEGTEVSSWKVRAASLPKV